MAGSTFGTILKVTTFGESHGIGLGAVLDGCPAGLPINEEVIQQYLNLRKPGQTKYSTPRKEQDKIRILSGVFEGKTTGTPILLLAENETQRSQDYSEIASYYRPGHADFTFDEKYGFRDYRGGGRSSGRETLGRVAAGAIALEFLKTLGIEICAYTKSIGTISCQKNDYISNLTEDNRETETVLFDKISKESLEKLRADKMASPLYMPDGDASCLAEDALMTSMENKDSMGGIIECIVSGMPAGIGEPVFDKLDASLAKAMLSIGAVKGFELGAGFAVAESKGSENNDAFVPVNGEIRKATNHAGGILGGMSDGSDIIFRTAIKPTPSIFSEQSTVNKDGNAIAVEIKGRHDPIIVPRAVVVVEAMTALTIADALLVNMHSKLDSVQAFYNK
ncbi:MAG: chorismate synthase [Lachnospiraceae bacterium]|nr:chorismate synthase [Lachnospiraceae bacterium]